jgi:hypothetical protein
MGWSDGKLKGEGTKIVGEFVKGFATQYAFLG